MTRMSKVTIDRHEFYLASGASVKDLNATISDTMRAGGGTVTLPLCGTREITALVGPGIMVIVEEFDRIGDDSIDDMHRSSFTDFDYDDYQGD